MKLKEGICGVCDVNVIWYFDQGLKRVVFTDKYTEISIALSDESIASHAICVSCAESLNDKKIASLLERIKETWFDEMVGWAADKDFEDNKNLTVKTWDLSDDVATENLKVIMEDERQIYLAEVKQQKEIAESLGITLII